MFFITSLTWILAVLCVAQVDNVQAYRVHEDRVKPDKVQEYEAIMKECTALLEEHNVEGAWLTSSTVDYRYMHVSPISGLDALAADGPIKKLAGKIGSEEIAKILARFDQCYDQHGDYVLNLDKDLSYMPDGWDISTPGENYRRFDFYYIKPENLEKTEEIGVKVKSMFQDKNSKFHYRIYRSGFGSMGPYILVVHSAKDAADHARKIDENRQLLGEEFLPLLGEFTAQAWKIEQVHGSIRPDLSYQQATVVKAADANE